MLIMLNILLFSVLVERIFSPSLNNTTARPQKAKLSFNKNTSLFKMQLLICN